MQEDQNAPSMTGTMEAIRFGCWVLMRAYASFLYAFARHGFGPKYFGWIELGGILVPILFVMTIIVAVPPSPTLLPFLANVYLFLMIWHRVQGVSLSKKIVMHSRYNGYPRLCAILPLSEEVVKSRVEPFCVSLSGFPMMFIDPILGLFLILGGFVMSFDNEAIVRRTHETVTRVVDAEIEDSVLNEEIDRRYRRRSNG